MKRVKMSRVTLALLGLGVVVGCSRSDMAPAAQAEQKAMAGLDEGMIAPSSVAPGAPMAAQAPKKGRAMKEEMADRAMANELAMAPPPPPGEPAPEGGATAATTAEPVLTRAWFPETFLFAPRVITDVEGKASLSVRVPDRLTTWRVLALAHARNGAQAGTVTSFASQLPVSVDVVAPPQLVAGDRVALPIQLQNMTSERQRRTLQVQTSGGRLEGSGGAFVIPEGGTETTTLWLQTRAPGAIAVEARIDDDAVVKSVEVLPAGAPVHRELTGTLASPRTLQVPAAVDEGAPIAGSGRVTLQVFPGALAVLRSELGVAAERTGVADDGALVTLSAVAPTLSTRLGQPVDDATLLRLRRLAAQRLARVALSPSLESATALAGGAARHDHDGLLGRTGEHLAAWLARQQRPDGTFGGGGDYDVQRLLVATADAVLALQQAGEPLTTSSSTTMTTTTQQTETAKQRATAAGLKARGAFERMLPQSDDAYTAAAVLMTGVLDGEAKEALQQKVLAALSPTADGGRFLMVDEVRRADGGRPDVVEATARAILALHDRADAAAVRADLGAFLLQHYRPGRGFGDGHTNRMALLALGEVFAEPLPAKVAVALRIDGKVVAEETLEGDRLRDVLRVSAPLATPGAAQKIEIVSDPPLPGLIYLLDLSWSVPFPAPAKDAPLALERTLPPTLRVGQATSVQLAAVAPGGAPVTVTLGLPAGVDVVTRGLEQLRDKGVITRFEVVDGRVSLEAPARAQGERFTMALPVVPTLAGELQERVVSVATGGAEVFLPPVTWRIAR
jgi:hypothetical protein